MMENKNLLRPVAVIIAIIMTIGISATGIGGVSEVHASNGYKIITTAAELDAVRNDLSGKYKLGADIDLSTYSYNKKTWTSSAGWDGIGISLAKGFTGEFDGDGYTISGLWSKGRGSNQGLFSWVVGGTVKNLNIELADDRGILGAGERRAALAGNAYAGSVISDVKVSSADETARIEGSANYIAGLVGVVKDSTMKSCEVSDIDISGSSYVAGIAGVIYDNSSVYGQKAKNLNLYGNASYVGGSIGCVYGGSTVCGSSVVNAKVEAGASYAGGFVGAIHERGSSIANSYVTGVSSKARASYAGGFAGVIYHYASVEKCCASNVNATAVNGRSAGGFTGELYDFATASRCYAVNPKAQGQYYVGGWSGAIYGNSSVEISCAHGKGTAKTTRGYVAGGFAGYTAYTTISNCYSQVNVATEITGGTGGFVGFFEVGSKVYNSYSSGKVTNYQGDNSIYNGAYSGYSYVTFGGKNYFDNQVTGGLRAYGSGGKQAGSWSSYPQGKDTPTMMKKNTFEGWDFVNIWAIDETTSYPYFWKMDETCGGGHVPV